MLFGPNNRLTQLSISTLAILFIILPTNIIQADDQDGLLLQIPAIIANNNRAPEVYGEIHSGQYHLGPVDFAETVWHNACAPGGGYRNDLRANAGLGGEYLAGVSHSYAEGGQRLQTDVSHKNSREKKHYLLRVVTYPEHQTNRVILMSALLSMPRLNLGEYPET